VKSQELAGEGLYPLWRDPDAEAGAGGIADRVKGLARLERPNGRVGELRSHGVSSLGFVLAGANKVAKQKNI